MSQSLSLASILPVFLGVVGDIVWITSWSYVSSVRRCSVIKFNLAYYPSFYLTSLDIRDDVTLDDIMDGEASSSKPASLIPTQTDCYYCIHFFVEASSVKALDVLLCRH
jgi:hypothetical protein